MNQIVIKMFDKFSNLLESQKTSSQSTALQNHSKMYRNYIEGKSDDCEIRISLCDEYEEIIGGKSMTMKYSDSDTDFSIVDNYIETLGEYL